MLANLILQMNQQKKPLARFWYLPHGYQAAVVMTGDDHANGGTVGRFNTYLADSAPGCSVADWQCVRSTSYVYPGSPITDAQAASFVSRGFEVALHVTTNCADWTPATLDNFYVNQLATGRPSTRASMPLKPIALTVLHGATTIPNRRLSSATASDSTPVTTTGHRAGSRIAPACSPVPGCPCASPRRTVPVSTSIRPPLK
jgi:hypothetical protein